MATSYIDPASIQPGPQQAGKYARVGPNYLKYGEVPGYVYYYPTDSYYVDPNAVKKQYQEQGLIEKQPGMTDIMLPLAIAAAAPKLGEVAVTEGLPWLGKSASGLLGLGGSAAPVTATTAAAPTAAAGLTGAASTAGTAGAAGAAGATGGATGGGLLSGLGESNLGASVLPALGAFGAYDLFKNERTGMRGALQGAASGAALGSVGGPVGSLIGGGVGLVAGLLNRWGDKDRWKTEQNRLKKLQDQGYTDITLPELTKGRSKQELIDIEKARGGNVKFAESRNEADLTPEEIANFATFYEKAGPAGTLADRQALARAALAAGAVREHHGTIDVDWGKVPTAGTVPTGMQQVSPQTVQGLMSPGVSGATPAIDAGTLKRWREQKEAQKKRK